MRWCRLRSVAVWPKNIQSAKYIEYPEGDHGFWSGETDALLGDIEEFVTGNRDSTLTELERVLATVLFTDIVDSTRSAATMGDQRWRRLLDDHDRLRRQIIGRHRGNLVKTTGDGILATFDGPRARRALCPGIWRRGQANWSGFAAQAFIQVRSNCVATISAVSRFMLPLGSWDNVEPSEVWVSRVVTDLVAGAGLTFAERGSHEFKGLAGRSGPVRRERLVHSRNWPRFVRSCGASKCRLSG